MGSSGLLLRQEVGLHSPKKLIRTPHSFLLPLLHAQASFHAQGSFCPFKFPFLVSLSSGTLHLPSDLILLILLEMQPWLLLKCEVLKVGSGIIYFWSSTVLWVQYMLSKCFAMVWFLFILGKGIYSLIWLLNICWEFTGNCRGGDGCPSCRPLSSFIPWIPH